MSAIWGTVDVNDLPRYLGRTFDEHVSEWKKAHSATQKNFWMLGAIAAHLVREAGGRPAAKQLLSSTTIQKFNEAVGISRNTFQRYSRTYAMFEKTRTTGGTSLLALPFKHFQVAARFFDEPELAERAIAEAHAKKWSANQLGRQLTIRMRQGPVKFKAGTARLKVEAHLRRLRRDIDAWPLDARKQVPAILRQCAKQIEADITEEISYAQEIRDVEEFSDDAPQLYSLAEM